jgi:hypothetical protein
VREHTIVIDRALHPRRGEGYEDHQRHTVGLLVLQPMIDDTHLRLDGDSRDVGTPRSRVSPMRSATGAA